MHIVKISVQKSEKDGFITEIPCECSICSTFLNFPAQFRYVRVLYGLDFDISWSDRRIYVI